MVEKRVLIISSVKKATEFIKNKMGEGYSFTVFDAINAPASSALNENFDFVVVNSPVKGGDGIAYAEKAAIKTRAGVLVLLPEEDFAEFGNSLAKRGVYPLKKPFAAGSFPLAVAFITASEERLKGVTREKESLKEKVEETKLVSRAKLLLVEKLAFTEEEAHRYIEKQAMDGCVKRSVVAADIIKTYKND